MYPLCRFAEEIAGTPVLGMLNRGEDAEVTTFVEKAIDLNFRAI